MDLGLFLRGAAFGVAIAAPVGPIAVLLIRRTLHRGRAIGYASGLGAATADLLYGLVVAFGLSAVIDAVSSAERTLQVLGGAVLLVLGLRSARSSLAIDAVPPTTRRGLLAAYGSTLALTVSNPATVVAFLALFAGVGLASAASTADSVSVAVGVAVGSAAWQLGLCTLVSVLRHRIGDTALRRINVGSGSVIAAFGLVAIASAAT